MAEYFMLFSPGLIGATLGSLSNSLKKGHDNKVMFTRVLESAVIGYPINYLVVNYLPITAGSSVHVAAVAGITFLFFNNMMTASIVEQADGYGTSLVGALLPSST